MVNQPSITSALELMVSAQDSPPAEAMSKLSAALEHLTLARLEDGDLVEVLSHQSLACSDLARSQGVVDAYPAVVACASSVLESAGVDESLIFNTLFVRGMAYLGFGEHCHKKREHNLAHILFDRSVEDLARAYGLGPEHFAVTMRLGYALNRLADSWLAKKNPAHAEVLFGKAASALTAAVELDKQQGLGANGLLAYNFAGYALIRVKRFDEALETLNVAVSRAPSFLPAYVHRGDAHRALDHASEAKEDYSFVIAEVQKLDAKNRPRRDWTVAIRACAGLRTMGERVEFCPEKEAVALGILSVEDLTYMASTQI